MKSAIIIIAMAAAFVGCTPRSGAQEERPLVTAVAVSTNALNDSTLRKATFAAGCFWCEEAVFESVRGVTAAISGYSGGTKSNPTYEQVGQGTTGHAEAVEVYYDATKITFAELLKVYFASLDPTQVNGQGPDHGPQYRSIIFYRTPEEQQLATNYIDMLNKSGKYNKPIAVEVKAFTTFWKAEDYHQDYVVNHPENPYVQHESLPRLARTQKQIPELLKEKTK